MVGAPSRAGFGAAVRAAVAEIPGRSDARAASHDWLWLLHDDSAPEPDALAELLLAVERAPSVTIAGAKQVAWDHPRELVDVGLSVSGWAERLTLIDVDEQDQGQYDSRSDIFAVNSAGMLVRRDVWDALGGFDPALPGVGDDIDLCWRNRLAGHRVVVVPSAILRHAASRSHPLDTAHHARAAEVYLRLKHATAGAVPFLAVGAVLGGMMRLLLGLLAKDPAHGAGQLVGSLTGVLRPLRLRRSRRSAARSRTRPRSVVRPLMTSRRDVWSHRRSVVDAHTTRGAVRYAARDDLAAEYVPSGDGNDDFAALTAPGRPRVGVGAVIAVGLLLAVSLTGLHRYVGAPALTGGALIPVADSPREVWESATTWWSGLGTGVDAHGSPFSYVLWLLALLGPGPANSAVVALVLCAFPLAGLAAWFAAGALTSSRGLRLWAALLWGAAPALQVALGSGRLGALVAHILLPLTLLAVVRAVGAGLTSRPLPDGVAVPGRGGTRSWTAAAAGGLLLALVTASEPSLLLLAVLVFVVAAIVGGRRSRHLWWTLLPAVALNLPYLLSALDRPWGLLGSPGVPTPFDAAPPWQHLLGFPVSFDPLLPPTALEVLGAGPWAMAAALVIGGPVVLLAAAALFLPGARTVGVRVFWLLAVVALGLAALVPLVPVAMGPAELVGGFPGPFVSVASLGFLAAALSGLPGEGGAPPGLRPQSGVGLCALRGAGGAVLLAGPLLSAALWVVPQVASSSEVIAGPMGVAGDTADATGGGIDGGVDGVGTDGVDDDSTTDFGARVDLRSVPARPLPATAADRGSGPEQTRTLVITVDDDDDADAYGGVSASVMRGSGTTLDALNPLYAARVIDPFGPTVLREDDESAQVLRSTVASIVGATGADPRPTLRDLGVGFVVLRPSETAGGVLGARIDSVPGLTAVGDTDTGRLWRVVPATLSDGTEDAGDLTARVRVVNVDGGTQQIVPSDGIAAEGRIGAGTDDRRLVLAEESHPGWKATLDGEPLAATTDGWQQAFTLPAEGGTVSVSFDSPYEPWAEAVQVVILALTALLAIPVPSVRGVVRQQHAGTDQQARRRLADRRQDRGAPPGDGQRTHRRLERSSRSVVPSGGSDLRGTVGNGQVGDGDDAYGDDDDDFDAQRHRSVTSGSTT